MGTDKDNVFTSFKVTSVDQYNYERTASVKYELEKESGLKTTFMLKHTNLEACGKLFYRTMAQENQLQQDLASGALTGTEWVHSPYNTKDFHWLRLRWLFVMHREKHSSIPSSAVCRSIWMHRSLRCSIRWD